MKKVISVVGARPNFIKIAPIDKAFRKFPEIKHMICHTGQHFDEKMSDVFFRELGMPEPGFNLGVGSGSHAEQTAAIMTRFEKVLEAEKPDLILVPGDVNSTLACSVVASKMNVPVAHVEAGLRSFDRTMPEEINRIITDVLSDLLFVSEESGMVNLRKEGIGEEKIHFVGNVMIDSLVSFMDKIEASTVHKRFGLEAEKYILVTFHRPANVDEEYKMKHIIDFLNTLAKEIKVIFPVHPRTMKSINDYGFGASLSPGLILSEPIGYIDFLSLTKNARLVITDSGGIQEETTYMGIPCITVRDNTERPVTVTTGTNLLIGTDLNEVMKATGTILSGNVKKGSIPPNWDGKTAERIVQIVLKYLNLR
jgi:UDP-N-acetylglucosamine 2-epimerase (non-hydrolysing)